MTRQPQFPLWIVAQEISHNFKLSLGPRTEADFVKVEINDQRFAARRGFHNRRVGHPFGRPGRCRITGQHLGKIHPRHPPVALWTLGQLQSKLRFLPGPSRPDFDNHPRGIRARYRRTEWPLIRKCILTLLKKNAQSRHLLPRHPFRIRHPARHGVILLPHRPKKTPGNRQRIVLPTRRMINDRRNTARPKHRHHRLAERLRKMNSRRTPATLIIPPHIHLHLQTRPYKPRCRYGRRGRRLRRRHPDRFASELRRWHRLRHQRLPPDILLHGGNRLQTNRPPVPRPHIPNLAQRRGSDRTQPRLLKKSPEKNTPLPSQNLRSHHRRRRRHIPLRQIPSEYLHEMQRTGKTNNRRPPIRRPRSHRRRHRHRFLTPQRIHPLPRRPLPRRASRASRISLRDRRGHRDSLGHCD